MSMTSASGLPLDTLVETVKANITIGDRDAKRSEDRYMAAGIHLAELKARLPVEEPGAQWVTWVSQNFPQIGLSRIDQLMRIGRGETTQAEINAASNMHREACFEEAFRAADDIMRRAKRDVAAADASDATEADVRQRTSEAKAAETKAADAERKRRERAVQRAARVKAGADLPPPLAPIEHRRLLKQGRDLLGAMSFDDLKLAVAAIKAVSAKPADVALAA